MSHEPPNAQLKNLEHLVAHSLGLSFANDKDTILFRHSYFGEDPACGKSSPQSRSPSWQWRTRWVEWCTDVLGSVDAASFAHAQGSKAEIFKAINATAPKIPLEP